MDNRKKYSEIIFIVIMGLGMSLIMTLAITYINTGMDSGFINRWLKALIVGFQLLLLQLLLFLQLQKN